jgi:hypothetical protein
MTGDRDRSASGRGRAALALLIALVACLALPTGADAATAGWAFEPATYDFGAVMPDAAASPPVPFVLRNTGEVTLRPALVTLSSGGGGIFRFQNGCGAPLPPGATCTVEVTFRATSAGPKESNLEMSELNSAVPPAVAHLTGAGAAPTVTVDPTTLDFGTVPLGTAPAPLRTITVTNSGLLELAMSGLEFQLASGADPGTGLPPFTTPGSSTCRPYGSLPAGGSCTITMNFWPRVVGPASAELRLIDDALDSPQIIHLTGTGSPEVQPQPTPPAEEPKSVLGHHPRARTKSRTATFTFSGNSTTAGFVCRLDRGPFRACTSPIKYKSLKLGSHRFTVRATSSSGVQTEGAYYGWQVIAKRAHKKHPHHAAAR